MNLILLFTCVLMWALAVLTAISLVKLLKEMDRLDNELEKQQEELILVEGAICEITKVVFLPRIKKRTRAQSKKYKGDTSANK